VRKKGKGKGHQEEARKVKQDDTIMKSAVSSQGSEGEVEGWSTVSYNKAKKEKSEDEEEERESGED